MAEYTRLLNRPDPEHPMLSFHTCEPSDCTKVIFDSDDPVAFSSDFYTVSFKKFISGEIRYGRTKYDYTNGVLMFTAPRQELVFQGVMTESVGYNVAFHEDFIKGHEIRNRIKKYSFFSYAVNEALHLSPREEKLIESIFENIGTEYNTNPDEFSKDIILAHIDALLKYSNRYYKRQFINRKELTGEIFSKFEQIIFDYFSSGKFEEHGVPTIESIATALGMSPRYLSDSLKAETGKSAMDHIHLCLMDEAKNLLLEPNITISEAAYKLGFEYPHYFSRLFKKKVGINPTDYRRQHMVH